MNPDTTFPPAPDSCDPKGQAGAVNGGRRSSAQPTRSALDGAGMGRTLPVAGAGLPLPVRDLGFYAVAFKTPQPVAEQPSHAAGRS